MVRDVARRERPGRVDDRAHRSRVPASGELPGAGRPRTSRRSTASRRSLSPSTSCRRRRRRRSRPRLRGGVAERTPGISVDAKTRVLAVASGKGGVGKSSLTANLAAAFARLGHRTGVLDADVYGYSIPHMLGIHQRPIAVDQMIVPPVRGDLKVMSIGFFLDENTPGHVAGADAAPGARAVPLGRALGRAGHARRGHAARDRRRGHLARPASPPRGGSRRDDAARSRAAGGRAGRPDGAQDEHAPSRRRREHVLARARGRHARGALRLGRRGGAVARGRGAAPRPHPLRPAARGLRRPGRADRGRRAGCGGVAVRSSSSREAIAATRREQGVGIVKSLPLVSA